MDEAGAIAIFCGRVRGFTHDGKEVEKLELETHKDGAEGVFSKISEDIRANKGVVDVFIHHMVGTFDVGEDMVYVIVAGKSRKDVFPALTEAVERYKHEAPIWKKEYLKDGTAYWIDERVDQKPQK